MIKATVIVRNERLPLVPGVTSEPVIVPAETLLIEIQGVAFGELVRIDDEASSSAPGPDEFARYVLVDCFRSTGFHKLEVQGEVFWFGTSDAKLELQGIVQLLSLIEREGLSWGKQLMFSDGKVLRDDRINFAWVNAHGRELLDAIEAISANPHFESARRVQTTYPRGHRALPGKSFALLRSNPKDMLEAHPQGLIELGGRRWMPRKIVARTAAPTFHTYANRRATQLLVAVSALADSLVQSDVVPKHRKKFARELCARSLEQLGRFPYQSLKWKRTVIGGRPTAIEQLDPRYRTTYRLAQSLVGDLGWSPSQQVGGQYAYIGYSDEIYQAFVATVLAEAFGAPNSHETLRPNRTVPSFESRAYAIYYDTAPPSDGFGSWRDRSIRPAKLTPDYSFVDKGLGLGLLGDAKYRVTKSGRLPDSALHECQTYMQHFGLPSFVVFYPGGQEVLELVEGDGQAILVASITPFDGLLPWARETLRPALEQLMTPLKSRAPVATPAA